MQEVQEAYVNDQWSQLRSQQISASQGGSGGHAAVDRAVSG